MDANSSSAGTLVAGANGQCFDWSGLHIGFPIAVGHGVLRRGQRRHLLSLSFDHPKSVVPGMLQGASGHGGEVARPIATRILERTLAQDEGNFDMQVAWLIPAHHSNPLELIKSVSYTGSNLGGEDEEGADT